MDNTFYSKRACTEEKASEEGGGLAWLPPDADTHAARPAAAVTQLIKKQSCGGCSAEDTSGATVSVLPPS